MKLQLTQVCLVFILLLVSGCLDLNDAIYNFDDLNRCENDDDCAATEGRCDLELQACVAVEVPFTETVVLYISDPQLGFPIEERIELVDGVPADAVSIDLEEPVLVRGLIRDDRSDHNSIAAQLTLRRHSEYEGVSLDPIYVDAVASPSSDGGVLYNYQARLTPGRYEVVVNPIDDDGDDSAVQPYYPIWDTLTVGQTVEPGAGDFSYSDENTRWITSVVHGPTGTPIGGVEVYAYEPVSGHRLSNVATTTCVDEETCGRFSLAIRETTDDFRIHLAGADPATLLPELSKGVFKFSQLDSSAPYNSLTDDELPEIGFGELEPPVLFDATILATDLRGIQTPYAGAVVEIRSVVGADHLPSDGSYELFATTSANGIIMAIDEGLREPAGELGIGILLRPGDYEVTVIPQTESEYATTSAVVTIDSPPDPEFPQEFPNFVVNSRARLSGVVLTPFGDPVPFAQLEITNDNGASFGVTSDELGSFSVLVDRQLSDILCIPPVESLLSWSRLHDVDAFNDREIEVVVGLGLPVTGEISRRATGEPLVDGLIEAYVVRQDPDGPTTLESIARIRTSLDGQFTFLVPGEVPW